jgi:glycine/D-amino acid oxidase-like deaminating enzyme
VVVIRFADIGEAGDRGRPVMPERIAIVGAGIIGSIVAREIVVSRPMAQVFLIDRDMVGLGASQRSAGVHFPIGKTERARSMAAFSERYYTELGSVAPSLIFRSLDLYAVMSHEAVCAFRHTLVAASNANSTPPQCNGLLSWPRGFAALPVPGCHYADVGSLARFVVRELGDHVILLEGVAVEAIAEKCNGLDLMLGSGETLPVDRVVLAPGPWVQAVGWREVVEPLNLRVKKIVAFHLDGPVTEPAAAMLFPEEDAFIIPMPDRRQWLYSYTCSEWDVVPDGINGGVNEGNLREARAVLQRYAPVETAPAVRSGRVFCDAYSPAREPVVTTVGKTGRIIFAGAANGSGYRLAPGIAREVVQLLN